MKFPSILLFLLLLIPDLLCSNERKMRALYDSLDHASVSELLAFHELYPETNEGQYAQSLTERLLSGSQAKLHQNELNGLAFISQIASGSGTLPSLSETQLSTIERFSQRLANRPLKGFGIKKIEEVAELAPEEIDIARATLLSQDGFENDLPKIRSYEAVIDLMALQVLARLSPTATPAEKIEAINRLIFLEMGFRFPTQGKYLEAIDRYTFLPAVLDSRRGVCLGVSVLYLSIAQRLGLSLEAVTPPGHIYLRYKQNNQEINIETTARGIHLPSSHYLSIDTPQLQVRSLREVIGLVHINHASIFIKERKYQEALQCYEQAAKHLRGDPQVLEFQGYCHHLLGNKEHAKKLLQQVLTVNQTKRSTLAEDCLLERLDAPSLEAVLVPPGEKREALLQKKGLLKGCLQRFPDFRDGWQTLAMTCFQLHHLKEGLGALEAYHQIDPKDPKVEYYLAMLNAEQANYPAAWKYLLEAEKLTLNMGYSPKVLRELRVALMQKGQGR